MPPFSESNISLGFTSSLLDTLRTSRVKLDAYVEDQKSSVGATVAAHEEMVRQEQTSIDQQVQNLLALQQDRGSVSSHANASNQPEGLMQRKNELNNQKNKMKEEVTKLQEEHAKRERNLEGTRRMGLLLDILAAIVLTLFSVVPSRSPSKGRSQATSTS
jgi:hypothetical protein